MSTKKAEWIEMDAAKARELIGFRTELKDGEKGIPFTTSDGRRAKFVLDRNRDNRPFRMALAERYRDRFFRGEWAGQPNHPSDTDNGDSWSFDRTGQIVSCAHRCVGLILAQERRDLLEKFGQMDEIEEYSVPDKISVQALVVTGLDPAAADTVDTGQTRSLGDVLFRRHAVKDGKDLSASAKVLLNRELAVAVRLVWLRLRGEMVSSGGKLDFPEAVSFLDLHPLLTDCLIHVYNENGGSGEDGRKIQPYISFGYAAALMYLAAFSDVKREDYQTGNLVLAKKPNRWDAAEKFWTLFGQFSAKALTADKAPQIGALHSTLDKNRRSQGDKFGRDAICTLVARAWVGWIGDEKDAYDSNKALVSKLFVKSGEKEVLNFCRFGGLDVDREVLIENGWMPSEAELVRKQVGDWKIGETAWVDQPKVDPWFGEIVEFSSDGKVAKVQCRDDGPDKDQIFQAEVGWLTNHKPKRETPKEEKTEAPKAEKTPKAKVPPKAPTKKAPPKKAPPVAAI